MAVRVLCVLVFLGWCSANLVSSAPTDLKTKYPFSVSLLSDSSRGYYTLHWNFTRVEEIIYFAVNVSSKGWVGFGLSPNGGMVGSDVVIGWVNDGAVYFKDRYADAQAIPEEDTSQDWCLTSAEEDGDYTILEFNRKFETCDSRDRDITTNTARVVWSFHPNDPSGNDDANLQRHTQRGAASINLLGGNPKKTPVREDDPFLDITLTDVTIPPIPTLYWCETYQTPPSFRNTTHFITRMVPSITPHTREFVHHLVVHVCPRDGPLPPSKVGVSELCPQTSGGIGDCLGNGAVIGGWAVGGNEVIYPEGTAFPIGGNGEDTFIVIQVHYDNPFRQSDIVDNSGIRFYYNTQEPKQRVGILYLGVNVNSNTVIPPRSDQFTITSVCSPNCTSGYIPPEGITMIGNFLHTHLIGVSLTLRHYRYDTTTNQLMELEPIDQNTEYDFDFQQFTLLPSARVVKPGDILILQCTYNSSARSSITLGGPSTRDEMCLTFPIYYPKAADGSSMIRCSSTPDLTSLPQFYDYIIGQNLTTEEELQSDLHGTLDNLDWAGDSMLTSTFQQSLSNGRVSEDCIRENTSRDLNNVPIPQPDVIYQPPDDCVGVTSGQLAPTCLKNGDVIDSNDGALPVVSASFFLVVSLVTVLLSIVLF